MPFADMHTSEIVVYKTIGFVNPIVKRGRS